MPDPRHVLGARAEEATAAWLKGAGWRVLARRWRSGAGELDLVCLDPSGALVGVEVKLRRTARAGSAADSINRERLGRLRATLAQFAAERAGAFLVDLRLDLVTVTPAEGGEWRLARFARVDAW
ncbi:MAG: YraN family protein [Chloroflexota bacterium]|nr:YraN family protein [Chloroflexota bacterium]